MQFKPISDKRRNELILINIYQRLFLYIGGNKCTRLINTGCHFILIDRFLTSFLILPILDF